MARPDSRYDAVAIIALDMLNVTSGVDLYSSHAALGLKRDLSRTVHLPMLYFIQTATW